ncbi:hypothetical protein CDV31_004117 [Fusarium ambrosium]|uniref:Uncharacterized protein n=1 Tax=Fusarium ambrosium TaxID=131363 RepID=A0A428URZ5_9HYPO|nr:hypothetical protein CDV31_004117 [Fusarium ambrosium]
MVSSKFLTSAFTFLAIGMAYATNCRPSDSSFSTAITQSTTSDTSTLITITTASSASSEASTSVASTTSTSIAPLEPNWCSMDDDCQDGCANGAFCSCINGICSEYI